MVQRRLNTRISRDGIERKALLEALKPLLGDRASREEDLYLTTSEVALLLHVSPATVRRWADGAKLPASRSLGGHRMFKLSEVRNVLDSWDDPVQPPSRGPV